MSTSLNDLAPRFRPLAVELLARCVEARIPIIIVDTLRTPAEHAANLAKGVSWVKRSQHLDGLAIDICPYDVYRLAAGGNKLQWDSNHPIWAHIGIIGEGLGLRWGGRWKVRDVGHFEYVEPPPPGVVA